MMDPIIKIENHPANDRIQLARHYIHVDNGGYSFAVIAEGRELDNNSDWSNGGFGVSIEICDGYYGYSNHTMDLCGNVTPKNLREIAQMFLRAACRLEERGVE